ncbi:PREDICTED: uncharacterized protein LOC105152792 [Acromyrmex echinatior]|uniref:uncharacterized protein LOC105152792 n=1 Tax=Acromyrmex echinatior TaxID=103372 RepID=UPI000580F83E|nr:PREDICTED: uncharacterized protein LOC105152792 [Acromyrmex echinatior]
MGLRQDFFKIPKRGAQDLKKRKGLVDCSLDDRLSWSEDRYRRGYGSLYGTSPKSVVAETLRVLDIAGEAERRTLTINGALGRQIKVGVNVAKIAVQRLVSDIDKRSGPSDEIRANNLALEREIIRLRREMDLLRRVRDSLRDQVESLRRTVQIMRDGDRGRDLTPSLDEIILVCDSPISRRSRGRSLRRRDPVVDEAGRETGFPNRSPVYRSLGETRKKLEDVPPRPTKVDRRIIQDVSLWWARCGSLRMIVVIREWTRGLCAEEVRLYQRALSEWSFRRLCRRIPWMARHGWRQTPSVHVKKPGRRKERKLRFPVRKLEIGLNWPKGCGCILPYSTGSEGNAEPPCHEGVSFSSPKDGGCTLEMCGDGGQFRSSYADVVRLARGKISLEELNIANTRIRKAQAGGLLIEIPRGEEADAKAEALVDRLKAMLAESEDRISVVRPVYRAEVRLIDVDQSVSAEEVVKAVATIGEVPATDIRTGPFRPGRGGLNIVWVQCPLACANRLIKAGRIRLGWSSAGIVPLAKRRLQCFRCLAVGHTKVNYQNGVDRSTWYFQCGGNDGHRAAGCRLPPHCPVSAARGLAAGHRAGATECVPFNGREQVLANDSNVSNVAGTSTGVDRGTSVLADEVSVMDTVDG